MRKVLVLLIFVANVSMSTCKESYKVTDIPNVSNWCSNINEFNVELLKKELAPTECEKGKFIYGKYFRIKAKSNFIDVVVKTGYEQTSLKEPVLYLMDENLKPIACANRKIGSKSLGLYYNKLEKKEYYIIGVLTEYEEKDAEFTICMNDKISQNVSEGAVEIETTDNYCTKTYESINFTPTSPKISCLNNGPNHNSWFKFTAESWAISIKVKANKKFGNFQHPYMGLFDGEMNELKCAHFSGTSEAELNYYDLEIGSQYYLSVDQEQYRKYMGGFEVCFDNSLEQDYVGLYSIVGRVQPDQIINKQKINLKDLEAGVLIRSAIVNEKGQFTFDKLPSEVSYSVFLEEYDENVIIDVFMLDEDNMLFKKGEDQETFMLIPKDIKETYINLISEEEIKGVKIERGKTAILGKVVYKNAPFIHKGEVEVVLLDRNNLGIDSVKTDVKGTFAFNHLDPDAGYSIKMKEIKEDELFSEIVYVDDENEVMMYSNSHSMDEAGVFRFQKLPHSKSKIDLMALEDVSDDLFNFDLTSNDGIVIENIHFRSGDAELLESSLDELNKLVRDLEKNTDVKIAVYGYTDNVGDANSNIALSEERAKAVVNYLYSSGIDKRRLKFAGFGNKNPIASNNTPEGRMKNRRVEFEVVD